MNRSRVAFAALAAAVSAFAFAAVDTSPADAHHGWSTYTVDDFTLEGVVTELRFGNPHDRLTVVADGVAWDVWLGPPSRNMRASFNEMKVAVGDTVIAYGNRHMDGTRHEMKTERITVRTADGETTFDLYPERLDS